MTTGEKRDVVQLLFSVEMPVAMATQVRWRYDVRPGSSQLTSLSSADKSVCRVLRTAFVQARQN